MTELLVVAVGGLAVVVLLGVSAFFSSSEIALFSLPDSWFEEQAAADDHRAAVLTELHADPHRLLVTLLVGNNVVNIAISSIVAVIVTGFLSPGSAVVVTTLLTSFLVLLFGEIVPKVFGLGNAERWSLVVAVPIRAVERILSPLITFFDWITGQLEGVMTVETDIEAPLRRLPKGVRVRGWSLVSPRRRFGTIRYLPTFTRNTGLCTDSHPRGSTS